jgi:hypothetical protein
MPDVVIVEGPFRTRRKARKRERIWQSALADGFASDRLPVWANGVRVSHYVASRLGKRSCGTQRGVQRFIICIVATW